MRKKGIHFSIGELEAGIGAGVMPVFNRDGEMMVAMALVPVEARIKQTPEAELRRWLDAAAATIRDQLS